MSKTQLPSEYLDSRYDLQESQLSMMKASISVIPVLGSAINEVMFDLPSRIQQRRINETVKILSNKIKGIQENLISKEYLQSDDFYDFTRKLFEESSKIKSELRRKVLSSVYLNSILSKDDFEMSKNRIFMRFISEFSVIHIKILLFIERKVEALVGIDKYEDFYNLFSSDQTDITLGRYEFKSYCNDLDGSGLVSLGSGLDDYNDIHTVYIVETSEENRIILSDLGIAFIQFLKE